MRKVMTVVVVLARKFHSTDQPRNGPDASQMRQAANAIRNARAEPVIWEILCAKRLNQSVTDRLQVLRWQRLNDQFLRDHPNSPNAELAAGFGVSLVTIQR